MRGPTVANPTVQRSTSTTSVVTPQAVLLQFRTAGIGSRVLAKLIDTAVQAVALIIISILAGIVSFSGSAAFIVGTIGVFLVLFVYPATEALMSGQTLGKRALSIRVITADGGPVRLRHATVRSLIGFLELYFLPIALITALLTRRSQRVGDLVAETVVVRDKSDVTQPVFFNPPAGAEQIALNLDTTRLSHPQNGVLRQFVLRSWEIEEPQRTELAMHLCEKLRLIGIERPSQVHPSLFVSAVVFAHQRRYAGGTALAPPPMGAPVAAPPPGGRPSSMAPPVGRPVGLAPPSAPLTGAEHSRTYR